MFVIFVTCLKITVGLGSVFPVLFLSVTLMLSFDYGWARWTSWHMPSTFTKRVTLFLHRGMTSTNTTGHCQLPKWICPLALTQTLTSPLPLWNRTFQLSLHLLLYQHFHCYSTSQLIRNKRNLASCYKKHTRHMNIYRLFISYWNHHFNPVLTVYFKVTRQNTRK